MNLKLIHPCSLTANKVLEFLICYWLGSLWGPERASLVKHGCMKSNGVMPRIFVWISLQLKILGVDMLGKNDH